MKTRASMWINIVLVVCLMFTGFQTLAIDKKSAADYTGQNDNIRARSIVLCDSRGRERIKLIAEDNDPAIQFNRGNPAIYLMDEKGTKRIHIAMSIGDAPNISFFDKNEKDYGRPFVKLGAGPMSSVGFSFWDSNGGGIGFLTADGKPLMHIKSPQSSVWFQAWPDGGVMVSIQSNDKKRLAFGIDKKNEQFIKEWDKDGDEVLWKAESKQVP